MKSLLLLFGVCTIALLSQTSVQAQNVFSGEPVQWAGRPNGYSTTPYGTDYRTTTYRKVSTTASNPTDGRAQWTTTINVQNSGGDFAPDNMPGGGGAGWLLISGPSGNRFQNKWNFNGVGQGALNAINGVIKQSGGQDMGLNMGTTGRYTFNMRDAGYVNTEFYVGYTANAPVTVSRTGQTFSGGQAVISISTSATPSSGENVYVRYRATTNDFTGSTSVVQASGSGTSWTANIPSLSCGSTYYYYVYTSTRTLSQIGTDNESDRSLATLRYDDNAGANYSFAVSASTAAVISGTASICSGGSSNLQVAITGGASPYSVVYNASPGGNSTVNNYTSGSNISVSPTANTTYTLVSVTGANGCAGSGNSGSAVVSIKTNAGIASATADNNSLCSGQTTNLHANGVAGNGAVVTWYSGSGGTGTNYGTGANLNGVGTGTYYARVTGDCGAPAEASVTVNSVGNTFSGTGNWTDNARWSCGAPPTTGDAITIAAGANATLNTDFTVAGSLTMAATSTLTVNPTRTLGVSGTADFAGQSVTFKSDNTGTASLGQVTGTLSNATNITVERYIPNNNFRSWRLLSVPVTSSQTIRQAWQEGDANPNPKDNNLPGFGTQITGMFTTQQAATAAGFDSTSIQAGMLRWNGTGWSNITSTNQSINNFNSYFLYIRGDRAQTVTGMIQSSSATTLRTKGIVYTGDQVTNVGAGAFAVIPNLYPSAIDFSGLTRTGGVSNLFYIWDSKKLNGSSLGIYQTFSATNSFNCLISGGSYVLGQPNTIIESGQSFFVASGAAGTITLKESAKINDTTGSLGFRPSAKPAKIDTRLYDNSNEMLDANAVVFDAAYSNAVDAEDAIKLGNPGANFAIEANSKLLAIEGTHPVEDKDVLQFHMWNLKQQSYKLEFAVSNMNNIEGLTAMLEDSYLKTSTAISLGNTTTLNFTVDGNAGSSTANRFRIVFSKTKPLSTTHGYVIAPNPVENGVMNLQFKNQAAGRYSVRVLTTSGQTVTKTTIIHGGGNASQSIILSPVLNKGTYTVEIVAPDKSKSTQTVLVNTK